MKNIKIIAAAAALSMMPLAWASDVYIDQTGDDVEINITQNNGMNRVNTDTNPAVVSGDNIKIDIEQDGDLNVADINLSNSSDGTILDYEATGSFNELTVDFATAINNEMSITVDGDNNAVSICGDLACTNSASVDDTVTTVDVDGSYNTVRFALNADNVRNTVNITGGSINNGNSVDVTQNSGADHVVRVDIAGGSNAVTIIQGQ